MPPPGFTPRSSPPCLFPFTPRQAPREAAPAICTRLTEKGTRVKTVIRFSRLAYRTAIMGACLLAVAGCRGEHSPGAGHSHDEEHAGHVIPAHRPKTFLEAIRRLR